MSVKIEDLLPHRPPMLWIDALTAWTETSATATARFDAEHFALADASVLETALVECVAQTVAAALGQRSQTRGRPDRARGGMLAAVSNFHVHARPPAGKTFCIEVTELKRFGPMLLVSGVVSSDGQTIASGELTLYA
jgi:3-hydroxyacyl-[acyl-carrier-protein] dehydratase